MVTASPLRSLTSLLLAAASLAACLYPVSPASAQATWDGQTDANWSTPTNWNPDGEPTLTTAVIFGSPIPLTGSVITLSAGEQALSLDFQDSYTLDGGSLTLGAASTISVSPTFTATINSVLGGAATSLAKNGAGTLVLSGNNTFTGALSLNSGILRATTSANALGTGAATLTLAGGELQLANDTALNFARNVTVTGNTQITADRLTAGAGVTHTLGTLSMGAQTLTIAAGTNATSGTAGVTLGATTLTGNATINTNAGALTTLGAVTMGSFNLIIGGAGDTTITGSTGPTSAAGTITKNDSGTLRFTADPNNAGLLTINGGVVELSHSGTVDFNTIINSGGTLRALGTQIGDAFDITVNAGGTYDFRASETMGGLSGAGTVTKGVAGAATLTVNNGSENTTFSGVIQNGLGTVTLAKNGTGTLTLTGANTYTGSTTLLRGTLILDFNAAGAPASNILASGSTLTFNTSTTSTSAGLMRIVGIDGNTSSQAVTSTAVTSGTNTLELVSGTGGTLNVNLGAITRAAGTLNIIAPATGTVSTTNGNGLLGAWATYTSGGTTRLARVTSNIIGAAAADFIYQTGLDIANVPGYSTTGIMQVDATSTGQVLQGAGSTALHSIYFTDTAARTFEIASGETLQFANSGTFISDTGAGQATLGATAGVGTITAGASGTAELVLNVVDSSNRVTANSVIANNAGAGVVTLTKAGAGEVILTAANTYTGATNVLAGILEIQNVGALGGIGTGTTVQDGATLEISGGLSFSGEAVTITGAGVGSAGAFRSVSGNNSWGTIIALGGAASIGADGGTLTLDVASGSAVNAGNNGLTFTGTGTIIVNDAITLGGSANPGMAKSGTGTLILNAASAFTGSGTFTLNDGVVRITNGAALGGTTGGTSVTDNASLELSGGITTDETITMANSTGISGSGAIHNVSGNNTITGAVVTDDGNSRLMVDAGTQLTITGEFRGDPTSGSNRTATIGGAGNTILSGLVRNGTGTTPGVLSIIKDGTGTLTMSNNNTYTGTTAVNDGTLTITGSTTTSAITVAAAATFNESATGSLSGTTTLTTAGTTTLAGTNTYTGVTNVTGGSTTLSGSVSGTAITVGSAATFNETSTGVLAGTTTLSTAGTTTLSGTNTTTGATTVTGGSLTLNYDTGAGGTNGSKLANAAVLTLGSTTVTLSGGSHVEVVGSTTLTTATKTEISRTSGTSVLALNAITPGAGASLNINGNDIASTTNVNVNGMLGPLITVTIGGTTEFATNSGVSDGVTSGGLIRAFTGYTDITRLGPSVLPDDITVSVRIVNGGTSGPITMGAATEINALKMDASDGPATIDPTGVNDVLMIGGENGGGVLQTATSGGLTIGGATNDGRLTTGGTANTTPASLVFINESTANAITVNSIIQNNGTDLVTVVKSGAGTLVLNGTNTYTGGTRLDAGILRATTSATALGSGGTLTIAGGELQLANTTALNFSRAVVITGSATFTSDRLATSTGAGVTHSLGSLDLTANNTTLTFRKGANVTSGTAGINFTGAFNTNGNAATIDVGADFVLTMSGSNGATGDASSVITKIGAGTWIISNGNNYWEGPTIALTQGTLDLRNVNALGDNSPATQLITAADGTFLRLGVDTANGDFRTDLTLTGTGGTVTLTTDRSTTGAATAQIMDSLNLGGNTLLVQGGSNVNSGRQLLTFDAVSTVGAGAAINTTTADLAITAAISGAGGTLTKQGAGQLTLSGVNTYTGATTVSGGNLQVGVASVGSLAASSSLNVNGATSVLSGTGTVNGLTTVTQGVIRPGDTGGTTVGTLNLAGGLVVNPTAPTVVAELQISGPSTSDLIHITGGLTLNSNSNIVVQPTPYTATLGDSFLLIDWTGVLTLNGWSTGINMRDGSGDNGTNFDLPDISASGYLWDISSITDGANGGLLRITVAAVPEPSRMLLLVGAFAAVLLRRRRR